MNQIRLKVGLIFIILLHFFTSDLSAQDDNEKELSFYTYKLSVDAGLSQSNTYAIMKDYEDFIWIGTDDGLNRYDGYEFKVFNKNPNDSNSIADDKVWVLFEDSKDQFWIGTNLGGLNLFDRDSQTFRKYMHDPDQENSISNNSITCIFEDSESRLWVGTLWGLNVFDQETESFRSFYRNPDGTGIAHNEIQGIDEKDRDIWVATKSGLSVLDMDDFTITNLLQSSSESTSYINSRLECLYISKDGDIWVGTNGAGLVRYDEDSDSYIQYSLRDKTNNITSDIVLVIEEDEEGNLFIGTDGAGLFQFDIENKNFSRILSKNDVSQLNASIYDMFLEDDLLWLGLYGGGINLINFNNKGFYHYEYFNEEMKSFGKNSVLSLVEDHDQNIWIGTDGAGLYKYNPKTRTFIPFTHNPRNKNSISGNVVKSLMVDEKGNIYAGTYAAGLNYINTDSNRITKYLPTEKDSTSLQTEHVWEIFQDSEGRIWVGQLGGLSEFIPDQKKFKHYPIDIFDVNNLGSTDITRIYEDQNNNIWVGTLEGGIGKLNKKDISFKRYEYDENELIGLSNNEIKEIFEDSNGKLWVGTNGGGLNYYDPDLDKFVWWKSNSGLGDEILSIVEDEAGNFWIGTFDGLARYNPESDIAKFYTKGTGIQGNEFNYNSKLKASDGTFYLGGLNGLTYFRPEDISDDTNTPEVALTDLYLFHEKVNISEENSIIDKDINSIDRLVLDQSQNVITLWYSALDYTLPKKNKYAYKMVGFDEDWNYVNEQRSATYTNLPPGDYTFHVIASNNEGFWNENGKKLKITVLAPWYKKPVSIIGFFILSILLFILVIRIRTKILTVQKRKLEQQVKRRTLQMELQKKELQKQNDMIVSQNEELMNKNEEIEAQHFQIEEKSKLLEKAHEEIKLANNELVKANNELEKVVDKRTEELRQTIQQLIKTDDELSTFLYRSSHDLRGPIVTLIGLSQLARMEVHDEKFQHYFDKISSSCTHMLHFLKQLNDTNIIFRSIKNTQELDWLKIINEIRGDLNKLDPNNEVKKVLDIDVDKIVYSDELMIKTIILNLLENSIQYRRRSDPFAKLKIRYVKNKLVIVVSDNGIGIDEDVQIKVFDMFYRGSEVSKGNGLGLFLVQKAVDLIGGQVELKSKKMEFTEITIEIPIDKVGKKKPKDLKEEFEQIFA